MFTLGMLTLESSAFELFAAGFTFGLATVVKVYKEN